MGNLAGNMVKLDCPAPSNLSPEFLCATISRLNFAKFWEYFTNKPREWACEKNIILCVENLQIQYTLTIWN